MNRKMVQKVAGLRWQAVRTAWGAAGIVADSSDRLAGLVLPVADETSLRAEVARLWPLAEAADGELLPQLAGQIIDYFAGRGADFSGIPVAASARTAFQRRVLEVCREIALGRTMTYAQVAAAAGSPRGARAVGQVMAGNPLPLVIPCHRVVGAAGTMTGFSAVGGTEMKRRLLDHEAAMAGGWESTADAARSAVAQGDDV